MEESDAHLLDSVPQEPPRCETPPIEESLLSRMDRYRLPREPAPSRMTALSNRPRTSCSTKTIFTDMSVPYDISYRRTKDPTRKIAVPEVPKSAVPTLINVHPPKGKAWISQQRKDAHDLKEKLEQIEKSVEKETRNCESNFAAKTNQLEKLFDAHQEIMDEFTNRANESTPERSVLLRRISDFYRNLATEIPRLKNDFEKRFQETESGVASAEKRKKELKSQAQAAQLDIERKNRAIENLNQQIMEYKIRCSNAETTLRDATNDKGAMTRSSQSHQQKLSELGKQIEEKRQQLKKQTAMIETLATDLNERKDEMHKVEDTLEALEEEVEKLTQKSEMLKSKISNRKDTCIKLRSTPLHKSPTVGRATASIQANRLPKPESPQKRPVASKPAGATTPQASLAKTSEITGQDQFNQIKSDMGKIHEEIPIEEGKFVIKTQDDLKKVREIILKNNNMFDYSVSSIIKVDQGDFVLENSSEDAARLFAEWIMARVMKNALKSQIRSEQETQTDAVLQYDTSGNDGELDAFESDTSRTLRNTFKKAPKNMYNIIRQSRFVRLLQSDCSDRPPKPFDWVIRTIRSIFDEKTVDDRTNERDGQRVLSLPEYIMIWAFRQWGRDDLIQKGSWDLFISAHHHMQRYHEIMLFVRFLDEQWTTEQLSFFLRCRTWCMQRCVSVPVEHVELNEYFTETYMTKAQVADFFMCHFQNTDPELIADLTTRGCSCADPERGNQDESACVPMQRILELAVVEQFDERVRRLRQMFAFYKIVPRMTHKQFCVFVHSLIKNMDGNTADSLYRSSMAPNTIRAGMEQQLFVKYFNSPRPIVPMNSHADSITCEEFAEFSDVYSMVLNRWKKFKPFLQNMLNVLNRQRFEEAKIIANEIRHQSFQLLEAKVSFDGIMFYQCYHRVLQTVMRSCMRLNLPDAGSFGKQIGDLQNIIDQKFDDICDSDDTESSKSARETSRTIGTSRSTVSVNV